ncbi:hypothetical protein [Bifidobacterium ruminantium]|uniref:hypothetical protein n=1 Tax=Bifidobacterium ruminantium TaxID=78346 RepID=UPI001EF5F68A|nr:hypothetical protein [Bifidobacterium ruminantium]
MDELQMLRDLPAVANVSKDRITYSNAFKQVCVIRYLAGESPTKIFREAGLPPELIGYKRIERSVARWKAAVLKSVSGSSNMSNGEIITELVNLYVHAVTRKEKLDGIAGIANSDKANIENAPHPLDGANVSGGGCVYPLTCPSHPMRLPSPCRLHLSARAAALTARRRLSSSNNRLGVSTSWNAKTNRSVAS